jgi:hypothetical protein
MLLILCSQELFNTTNAYMYCLLSYGDSILLEMFSGQCKVALSLFCLSIRWHWHCSIIDFLIWYFSEVISKFHMILFQFQVGLRDCICHLDHGIHATFFDYVIFVPLMLLLLYKMCRSWYCCFFLVDCDAPHNISPWLFSNSVFCINIEQICLWWSYMFCDIFNLSRVIFSKSFYSFLLFPGCSLWNWFEFSGSLFRSHTWGMYHISIAVRLVICHFPLLMS